MSHPGPPSARVHVVLVPGFGGFDALGQIEYYAGITPIFSAWQKDAPAERSHLVLHYFDNLPTAGIATRADRLSRWLAKRIARGEVQGEDTVALVGHSTGGLDIRTLVRALAHITTPIAVDGEGTVVEPEYLLSRVRQLVFLSVPHYGTNIADWVGGQALGRAAVVASLRGAIAAARVHEIDSVEAWLAEKFGKVLNGDLLLAACDTLLEIDDRLAGTASKRAAAHEADAELSLWLRHIASDFSAIDDLSVRAHANAIPGAAPSEDRKLHERLGIRSLSFATVGARPFVLPEGAVVPAVELTRPDRWPKRVTGAAAPNTDLPYRACYASCAGGPLQWPTVWGANRAVKVDGEKVTLELWDNDGIVNTASMAWPDPESTRFLRADHGDVIGHCALKKAPKPGPRSYLAYDLLKSGSGFDPTGLAKLWREVFDFCLTGK